MKYTVSHRLENVAHQVAKVRFLKTIIKPFYYHYKSRLDKKRNAAFKRYALEALSLFDSFMKEKGYRYTLAAGSLLGAIREKGFIKHDLDIDTFMWISDFKPSMIKELESIGFKIHHTYSIENSRYGREDTFFYKDIISLDIFYLYDFDGDMPYVCDWFPFSDCETFADSIKTHNGLLPRRVHMPVSRTITYTQFETLSLPIPENAHEVMLIRYGSDYMVPNPSYHDKTDNPHLIMWNDKIAEYKEY